MLHFSRGAREAGHTVRARPKGDMFSAHGNCRVVRLDVTGDHSCRRPSARRVGKGRVGLEKSQVRTDSCAWVVFLATKLIVIVVFGASVLP